jgi:hypothetical protein
MSTPKFAPGDRPRDILDGTGRWLAAQWGWRWVKSRQEVETRRGTRILRLGLQASKFNVEADLHEFEASGLPQKRVIGLEKFASGFAGRVMPVLELFESPAAVAHGLPRSWLGLIDAGTIEWALACGDREAAEALLRMRLWRAGMDRASRGTCLSGSRRVGRRRPIAACACRGRRSRSGGWQGSTVLFGVRRLRLPAGRLEAVNGADDQQLLRQCTATIFEVGRVEHLEVVS